MEFMKLAGYVTLSKCHQPSYLHTKILEPLHGITFSSAETAIAFRQEDNRLWIFGEGLVDLTEGSRVIKILRRLEHVCHSDFFLDTKRIFWELDISFGNVNPVDIRRSA